MTIGKRLKEFAKYLGSATILAAKLGMTAGAFSTYTGDKSKPGADILIKLHDLGCNINWLLTGDGEMLLGGAGIKVEKKQKKMDVEGEILDIKKELSRLNKKLSGSEFNTLINFSGGLKAAEPASTYEGGGIEKKK